MKSTTKTLTINEIKELENLLKNHNFPTINIPHTIFGYKLNDGAIIAYKSLKVLFQGNQAQTYINDDNNKTYITHAGSDEVGSGDYFGPLIVAAMIYDEKVANLNLNLIDSKQLTDQQICKIAPILIENAKYSLQILDNQKYNQLQPKLNLNGLKANLHQHCYYLLTKKYQQDLPTTCIVDQFVDKNKYYKYLINDYNILNLEFQTKAENKYPAVAGAAIIARYTFLNYLNNMNKKYDFEFPKGAGPMVDIAIKNFINKYDYNTLEKVAKIHFKNTEIIK